MKSSTLLIMVFLIGISLISCHPEKSPSYDAPLFDNMGNYNFNITAQSEVSEKFFKQGIILANAFNHLEAARSFRESIKQDSTCAMAYWGLAYVLGPNYNTANNMGESQEIQEAVRRAVEYSAGCTAWEKSLIDAIEAKFPADSAQSNDVAYYEMMQKAYQNFPKHDMIITLYAESIMNQHAWDLYTRKGGEPKPWTPEIVMLLEQAMEINPENPLANHLYLHATEAAPDVEKALVSAERLKTLVPGAGHLVHMPSHIYINTGDYHEGSLANERAVVVDSIYIAQCKVEGAYPQMLAPHNYHFLAATSALEGRGSKSIEAAYKTAEIVDHAYLTKPGFETTQHYLTIPYNVLVKFSQWEKIITLPSPTEDRPYIKAIWHYARGMAFANTGKTEKAVRELNFVTELKNHQEVKELYVWEINSASELVIIAEHVLAGEIERVKGNFELAENHFKEAIVIEDQLNYNEPPDWFFSVRHLLGDLYLLMDKPAKAEEVYRQDLTYWVKNGFALNGLYHSLIDQQKMEEANEVKKQFDEAWKYAEVTLKYSRIDEEHREDLEIPLKHDSAGDLAYFGAGICGS